MQRCKPLADLHTRAISRGPATHERLARLEDERLHLFRADAEHSSDFFVWVIAELKEHERGALISRQPLDVLQHFAQLLAALNLVCYPLEERSVCRHFVDIGDIAAGAQLRQAAIASDRVKPRA